MRSLKPLLVLLVLSLAGSAFAQGLPRDVRMNILSAVVQVIPWDDQAEDLAPWSGSGTIISPSGYILTNYHVVGDLDMRQHYDWHAIFWTDPEFTDQPPEAFFWARYVAGDPTHDLAILKIEQWIDESPVEADMVFPHVLVGDSNKMLPGDPITIVGYPGISGATITFTFGLMSGWVGEDFESGGKQWIKTDGKISHGNSGGGAFDENGNLIGVPTAGRTIKYEELDIEEQAYVRPISLAWALIGPHVTDVARAGGTAVASAPATNTGGQANQQQTPPVGGQGTQQQNPPGGQTGQGSSAPPIGGTGTTPAVPTTPVAPSGLAANCDFCYVGELSRGQLASAAITGRTEGANYHTYAVTVPAGTTSLVVELAADFDVDLAVKFGSQIENWSDTGDWEFRDISEQHGATFTISNPRAGTWFVDVIFFYDQGAANYDLSIR